MKSNFVYQRFNIRSPLVGHFIYLFIYFYLFCEEKFHLPGIRTHVPPCQKVSRLPTLNHRGDRHDNVWYSYCVFFFGSFWQSLEGFSRSFPSSTVKSNFVYQRFNIRSPLVGHFIYLFIYFYLFCEEKFHLPGIRTQVPPCQKVSRLPTEPPERPA